MGLGLGFRECSGASWISCFRLAFPPWREFGGSCQLELGLARAMPRPKEAGTPSETWGLVKERSLRYHPGRAWYIVKFPYCGNLHKVSLTGTENGS